VITRLFQKGFILDLRGKAKSIMLTVERLKLSERLRVALFRKGRKHFLDFITCAGLPHLLSAPAQMDECGRIECLPFRHFMPWSGHSIYLATLSYVRHHGPRLNPASRCYKWNIHLAMKSDYDPILKSSLFTLWQVKSSGMTALDTCSFLKKPKLVETRIANEFTMLL